MAKREKTPMEWAEEMADLYDRLVAGDITPAVVSAAIKAPKEARAQQDAQMRYAQIKHLEPSIPALEPSPARNRVRRAA